MTLYDSNIREPLFEWLEARYGTVRILEETVTGRSRADVVAVTNEGLHGIEIKSDADTYARLARQIRDYDRYYDFNTVVVGTRHAAHIEEHVRPWWGIITAEYVNHTVDFYEMRKAQPNPKVRMSDKLSLLWRPELAALQERLHLPKYKEKSKQFVRARILEKVPEQVLQREIIYALFERDYTLIEAEIESFRRTR